MKIKDFTEYPSGAIHFRVVAISERDKKRLAKIPKNAIFKMTGRNFSRIHPSQDEEVSSVGFHHTRNLQHEFDSRKKQ